MRNSSSGRYMELKTRDGQLIQVVIPLDSELSTEEIEKLAASIGEVRVPTTKWVGGGHNECVRLTRFELVPLRDEKDRSIFNGLRGAFKIVDPPDGRHNVVVYAGDRMENYCDLDTTSFFEFETDKLAVSAWKLFESRGDVKLASQPGCIRRVHCGLFDPWFFAVADQAIVGDLVFPTEIEQWWIFRHGQKFVVHPWAMLHREGHNFPKIKTCWGIKSETRDAHYAIYGPRNKMVVQYALWSDGTVSQIGNKEEKRLPYGIEVLQGESLLAHRAICETEAVAGGLKDQAEIVCLDGSRVKIQWIPADKKRHYKEAEYEVEFLTENGCAITYPDPVTFVPGEKGYSSLEEKLQSVIDKSFKLITNFPKDLPKDFKASDLDFNDPQTIEKYGISKIVKILSVKPVTKSLSGRKKWAGFFPEPRPDK